MFVQEIFKLESKESLYYLIIYGSVQLVLYTLLFILQRKEDFVEKFLSKLDDDLEKIDYKTFKEILRSLNQSLSAEKIESLSKEAYSGKLQQPLERAELKRKIYFIDFTGFSI